MAVRSGGTAHGGAALSTVVGVLDRPGWDTNTDVLVVVHGARRTLEWIPRDVLSLRHGERINGVFAHHGHDGLRAAVRQLGRRVRHSLVLRRELTELLLAAVSVEVPVARTLEYWYPLTPLSDLEDGRRRVRFDPPNERLEGLRIHEWLGARIAVDRFAGDHERIRRQQAFVRALLPTAFDPRETLDARPDLWSASGPEAGADLARVDAGWRMRTLGPGLWVDYRGQRVELAARGPGSLGRWRARSTSRRIGATPAP